MGRTDVVFTERGNYNWPVVSVGDRTCCPGFTHCSSLSSSFGASLFSFSCHGVQPQRLCPCAFSLSCRRCCQVHVVRGVSNNERNSSTTYTYRLSRRRNPGRPAWLQQQSDTRGVLIFSPYSRPRKPRSICFPKMLNYSFNMDSHFIRADSVTQTRNTRQKSSSEPFPGKITQQ